MRINLENLAKFPFNERDLFKTFYYFLSTVDLEACVQLLLPLKKKKKFADKDPPFFFGGGGGGRPQAYVIPISKRSHTRITKRNCAAVLARV